MSDPYVYIQLYHVIFVPHYNMLYYYVPYYIPYWDPCVDVVFRSPRRTHGQVKTIFSMICAIFRECRPGPSTEAPQSRHLSYTPKELRHRGARLPNEAQ